MVKMADAIHRGLDTDVQTSEERQANQDLSSALVDSDGSPRNGRQLRLQF